jgi:hypothetical protein
MGEEAGVACYCCYITKNHPPGEAHVSPTYNGASARGMGFIGSGCLVNQMADGVQWTLAVAADR